jgi:hypothetical protein
MGIEATRWYYCPGWWTMALLWLVCLTLPGLPSAAAQEITGKSEQALQRGLGWLAANQGPEGNWTSDDLGLVSLGALAFLADGHFPGRGNYGESVQRSLNFVLTQVRPSGLLNISASSQRDMYNHGLSAFVLGQAYGMVEDPRLPRVLNQALQLIASTQCGDGGWQYEAVWRPTGHDLSLVVMQAKALRSAVDSGFEVSPEVVRRAIRNVREHYAPSNNRSDLPDELQRQLPGQFCYLKNGRNRTVAMAAAGVVCLQEFGQYDDWRIEKNMSVIEEAVSRLADKNEPAMDPYTMYYVAQAAYQVGDPWWSRIYPVLRDYLVRIQVDAPYTPARHGMWAASGHVRGKPGELYATSVGCFVLAIPNRYLPILQEGKIEGLRRQFGGSAGPASAINSSGRAVPGSRDGD